MGAVPDKNRPEMFRFAANDIICKSLKIKISSRGGSCRLSPRRRGEDEGEGLGWSSNGVGCFETLTLPLSLDKGEATHARIMSSPHQKSRPTC